MKEKIVLSLDGENAAYCINGFILAWFPRCLVTGDIKEMIAFGRKLALDSGYDLKTCRLKKS